MAVFATEQTACVGMWKVFVAEFLRNYTLLCITTTIFLHSRWIVDCLKPLEAEAEPLRKCARVTSKLRDARSFVHRNPEHKFFEN